MLISPMILLMVAFAEVSDSLPSPQKTISETAKSSGETTISSQIQQQGMTPEREIGMTGGTEASGCDSLVKPETSVGHPTLETARDYWWIPRAREEEIKRKVKRADSIQILVTGRLPAGLALDLLCLRWMDGWYRARLGVSNGRGPRLWRFHMGGGIRRRVAHSTIDSVRGRELSSGYEIRLWEERIVRGPGPLSFYFGFGPNCKWEFAEGTTDSSRHGEIEARSRVWINGRYVNRVYVEGHYDTYDATNASSRALVGAFLVGFGARIHSQTGMALVGGMELGPEIRVTELSGEPGTGSGRKSNFSMPEPTWTLGADWFF